MINTIFRRFTEAVAVFALLSVCLVLLLWFFGLSLNLSPSVRVGVYANTNDDVRRGSIVRLCPAKTRLLDAALAKGIMPRGGCPSGSIVLVKEVVGLGGDRIHVDAKGVSVNGVKLKGSVPHQHVLALLGAGAETHHTLKADELFIMSQDSKNGLDGRYLGAMARESVLSPVRPIITW